MVDPGPVPSDGPVVPGRVDIPSTQDVGMGSGSGRTDSPDSCRLGEPLTDPGLPSTPSPVDPHRSGPPS